MDPQIKQTLDVLSSLGAFLKRLNDLLEQQVKAVGPKPVDPDPAPKDYTPLLQAALRQYAAVQGRPAALELLGSINGAKTVADVVAQGPEACEALLEAAK